jgi:hypothetical protein
MQTESGAHPSSYPMGTGEGSFRGDKLLGRDADHPPTTRVDVKKTWIYTATPPYVFMA